MKEIFNAIAAKASYVRRVIFPERIEGGRFDLSVRGGMSHRFLRYAVIDNVREGSWDVLASYHSSSLVSHRHHFALSVKLMSFPEKSSAVEAMKNLEQRMRQDAPAILQKMGISP